MNWRMKAHLLAVLSRLPAGRKAYHRLQRVAGTNRLDLPGEMGRALEVVQLIRRSRQPLETATCVEIGTGWRPFVPFILSLCGAQRVITLDINPWLSERYARETHAALEPVLDEIAAEAGQPLEDVQRRWAAGCDAPNLDSLLDAMHVEYRYPGDARATGLADDSVDLVVSSNVLEHIPRDVLASIQQESLRILRPGGCAVHRFNPGDHFAVVDSSITTANFVQFSTRDWHWYGGSGLAYHNRLRASQYKQLFRDAGFDLPLFQVRVDEQALHAIQQGQLPVHKQFAGFSPDDLAVDYVWVIGQKPVASPAAMHGVRTDGVHPAACGASSDQPEPVR
ncbi:class I SAM-dependent methyltransferase [Maioricimonas sp. JC845]|uniref:class I SAM-dependent methyltransferase n=1 Tax=Maioricimonas sp. JC845 TaxID=3232138 RepID=UPI0034582AF9